MAVVPANEWYDLWHVHPNEDNSDKRWANLLTAWDRVDATGRATGRPWQSWLVIEPGAPREDAAYLHTPNPNRENFPYTFVDVVWGAEPPSWATPALGVEFGQSHHEGVVLLWVRRRQESA